MVEVYGRSDALVSGAAIYTNTGTPMVKIMFGAFLDGFRRRRLLRPQRRRGAPTQVFADENAECPQQGLVDSLLRWQMAEERASGRNALSYRSPTS